MFANLSAHLKLAIFSLLLTSPAVYGSPDIIRQLIATDKIDSARQVLADILLSDSEKPATKYLEGRLSSEGKTLFDKYKWLEKNGFKGPEAGETLYQIAHYYYIEEKLGMAISYFRKSILKQPPEPLVLKAHLWMGITCTEYGRENKAYLDSALNHFKALTLKAPSNQPLYISGLLGMAGVNSLLEKHGEALSLVELARESGAGNISTDIDEVARRIYLSMGDTASAISLSRRKKSPQIPVETTPELSRSPQIPKSPTDSPALAQASPSTFSLQLGAYGQKSNAELLVARLKSQGIEAIVFQELRKNTPMYLVRIPGFPGRDQAEKFGEEKLKAGGIPYYLINPN